MSNSSVFYRLRQDATAEQHFQHELAAEIAQHQQRKTDERPAHRSAPAPTVQTAADEQHAEYRPGDDRQDNVVGEAQRLAEQFLGEEHAAHESEGQQCEANGNHAEQQMFHGFERGQVTQKTACVAAVQGALLQAQHDALHHGNAEQTVGREAKSQYAPPAPELAPGKVSWRVGNSHSNSSVAAATGRIRTPSDSIGWNSYGGQKQQCHGPRHERSSAGETQIETVLE